MKKIKLLTVILLCSFSYAQSKSITVTAGELTNLLTPIEKDTITGLIVAGNIDARDFKTMRDDMPLLAELDISSVNIVEYQGSQGTHKDITNYPANTLPYYAFFNGSTWKGKNSLQQITLPATLKFIGFNSMIDCNGISSIDIPNGVTRIGFQAFSNCQNLTQANLPTSLISTGDYTFQYCNKLTSADLPVGTETIGNGAFIGCTALSNIIIPQSVTSIGISAFKQVFAPIVVDVNNQVYSSLAGVLYNKDKTILIQCPTSIQDGFTILPSVNHIDDYAMAYNENFLNLVILDHVTQIDNNAFNSCSNLQTVSLPTGLTTLNDGLLGHCYALPTIEIPSSLSTIKRNAFYNCSSLQKIKLPSSVNQIGDRAFYRCSKLDTFFVEKTEPVDLSQSDDVFRYIKSDCVLVVPLGTLAAYAAANQWQDFTTIIEASSIQTDLQISDTIVADSETNCFNAYNTITVAGDGTNVIFESGSSATLIAEQSILFKPGFHAQNGSNMSAYITTDGSFCDDLPQSIVTAEPIAIKSTDKVIVPDEENSFAPQASLKVFPNPNQGQFTIQLENMDSQVEIMIFNAVGALVHRVKTNDESLSIDLNNAQRGIYFVRAINEKEVFTQKLIVE